MSSTVTSMEPEPRQPPAADGGENKGEVGVSAWNGRAMVRLVAADGAALRHDLALILTSIRGRRLPRLWLH